MEKIIKFKAIDGKFFDTEEGCIEYENNIPKVKKIIEFMGNGLDTVDFSNGKGYLLHDINKIEKAKLELAELASTIVNKNIQYFYQISLYCDYQNPTLYNAYNRLNCCDILGREWGQYYYKANPEKGINKQLN